MRGQALDPDELVKPLRPYCNKVYQIRIVINCGCSCLYGLVRGVLCLIATILVFQSARGNGCLNKCRVQCLLSPVETNI